LLSCFSHTIALSFAKPACAPSHLTYTKAITQIDFAAFAKRITFHHSTPFPDALAYLVKTLGTPGDEEIESTGRKMLDEHLLSMARAMLAVYQA
jgi:hypothetical protein